MDLCQDMAPKYSVCNRNSTLCCKIDSGSSRRFPIVRECAIKPFAFMLASVSKLADADTTDVAKLHRVSSAVNNSVITAFL